jgi:hypothetical protein
LACDLKILGKLEQHIFLMMGVMDRREAAVKPKGIRALRGWMGGLQAVRHLRQVWPNGLADGGAVGKALGLCWNASSVRKSAHDLKYHVV